MVIHHHASAQTDSSNYRFSGFQMDIGSGVYMQPALSDQKDLQRLIDDDPLVYHDFTGFTKTGGYIIYGPHFEGMAGGKVFLKTKSIARRELFVGLRYGESISMASHYSREQLDTLSSYVEPDGTTNYVIRKFTETYNFTIKGHRLFLPFGVNVSTRQERFFWFTAGLELTPFVTFGHQFFSNYTGWTMDVLVRAGQEPGFFGNNDQYQSDHNRSAIKGLATGLYMGLPLGIYLHPFRKENSALRFFNAFVSVMPLYAIDQSPFSGFRSAFLFNASAGIRFNFPG